MPEVHIYKIAPMDHWIGWREEYDFLNDLEKLDDDSYGAAIQAYEAFNVHAYHKACKAGLGAETYDGPYVAALPTSDGEIRLVMAWKQENNGTTFIASPVSLEHLEDDAVE